MLTLAGILFAGYAHPSSGQAVPNGTPPSAPPSTAQKPMTKDQAKELLHSVDEILSFVSTDT